MKKRTRLAATLVGRTLTRLRDKAAGLFTPAKLPSGTVSSLFGGAGIGAGRLGFRSFDYLGFDSFLGEVGKFNPLYVEPFMMHLMRRAVMPRLGLIILGAALAERSYVVEGGVDEEVDQFHQEWIDQLTPSILGAAPLAVWYGVQPYILDWTVRDDGRVVPYRGRDIDPFGADIIETEETRDFAGLVVEDVFYDRRRAFKLTWQGEWGNHYGTPMAITVYPYWWAWSVLLVWTMRYYQRSVDPVRMAMAQNVSVATGEIDSNGDPVFVDLTELVAEALDVVDGGDSVAVPLGADGESLVDVKTLDLPDRADVFLKMLAYLEEKQFLATLALPGIGVGTQYGDVSGQDARMSEKTQLRILEFISAMPIKELSELIAFVHHENKMPGPPPKLRGMAFKREQQETLLELFKTAMLQPQPVVGDDGKPTEDSYRPADLLRFDKIARSLDLPVHDISEVARRVDALLEQAPGLGGRPTEHLNDPDPEGANDVSRSEARESGRDR